ncbi:hypothetical protein NGRA_1034 [Nosema granulosis]|uniref:Rho-GAP domain-containing protein n=1 Tax=Nosema granulosis TaxID=83296 RepID=A0A9P6KZK5_9MICR|nr:hypothetical protein NGRA_1034 [Nosema granulosis]
MVLNFPAQIQVIPIDNNKNVNFKTRYQILKKRHDIASTERVAFSDLSKADKQHIVNFAQQAFIVPEPTKWWDFFNCFKKPQKIKHREINLNVFEIINYISLYIQNELYPFRLDNKDSDIQSYVDQLANNQRINFSSLGIGKLCTILKKYILSHLNGILPEEIASYLVSTSKVKNRLQYKALLSVLPYALSENEADLIVKIFDLFKIIDRNKDKTKMTMESLLKLFSLVMFPSTIFTDLDSIAIADEITIDVFKLDFDEIPFTLIPRVVMYV